MATERIIGVDFGTSTSVIRVKRYLDGRPVGDPLEVKQITFGKGNSMVPTLVQKRDSGETVFFGYDAEIPHRGTKNLGNFKVDLESGDADVRSQARALTREFFAYLAKTYKTQSEGGHLGESSDQERTVISYPVKWSNETKAFMLETAKAAGFPNVEGLDEAQAAIQAVTVQNADMLTRKGYFQAGVPVNILLIDMGAGTTDLVLCRHTPGTSPKTEILCTWPQKGTALFGGHEVDDLLKGIICDAVGEKVAGKISKEIFKGWKENMVSPALKRHEVVNEFSQLDDRADAMDMEIEYSVSRASFEAAAVDYLRTFPALVNGCLEEAEVSGDEVELVILTGGHSQWYFVQEMLRGEMPQLGRIQLSKVQQEPERIIPIALPQETVALGLVYGKLTPIVDQAKAPNATDYAKPAPQFRNVTSMRDSIIEARVAMQAKAHGAAISSSDTRAIGLKSDGTVVSFEIANGERKMRKWHDIIEVAAGEYHVIGLKNDGTVVACKVDAHEDQCNVDLWHNIIAVAVGAFHTVGLKNDRTVVATGQNKQGECNVNTWHNIIAVSAGFRHTVGLKSDGTVIATGNNEFGQCNVDTWNDIIAISAGRYHTVGLKIDGTVVAVGRNTMLRSAGLFQKYKEVVCGQCDVSNWNDIVAVAAGLNHTIGLRSDGTVVAAGNSVNNACNVGAWNNIIAVSAGVDHTIGLKSDGTVVAAGPYSYSRNVKSWKLF